jgi:hypothetical protein
MNVASSLRLGHSCQSDARQAAQEFHRAVSQPDLALVVFFCSSHYDLDALGSELRQLFGATPVLGCTSAGEIGPGGYREHSLCGASFSADQFMATLGHLDQLQTFEFTQGREFARGLLQQQQLQAPGATSLNTFALLLIDGLSAQEEPVASSVHEALGRIQLVGGSAADDLLLVRTQVYCDGHFAPDRAALALLTTPLPFRCFKIQHFVPTDTKLVVTAADVTRRLVTELNGRPAAEEYARAIGVPVKELSREHFAASPVLVLIGGEVYVRSIQQAHADGGLSFFCAIDEGLVLRVARGEDIVANACASLEAVRAELGEFQAVIGCDCFLRKLEIDRMQRADQVSQLVRQNRMIGFNTYGEQFCGVHVTQTLTGVAIGVPRD